MFEVVFDYGEHDPDRPDRRRRPRPVAGAARDPFSTYRPGFEVRTYRLCQRVLMFHHFPDRARRRRRLPGPLHRLHLHQHDRTGRSGRAACSVLAIGHPHAATAATARRLPSRGRCRRSSSSYSQLDHPRHRARPSIPAAWRTCPSGSTVTTYQWVDLDGEGLPGSSPSRPAPGSTSANLERRDQLRDADCSPLHAVPHPPPHAAAARPRQLLDLAGDGHSTWSTSADPAPGYYERTPDGETGSRSGRSPRCPNRRLGRPEPAVRRPRRRRPRRRR